MVYSDKLALSVCRGTSSGKTKEKEGNNTNLDSPTAVQSSAISTVTVSDSEECEGRGDTTNGGDTSQIEQLKQQLKRYVVKYTKYWSPSMMVREDHQNDAYEMC